MDHVVSDGLRAKNHAKDSAKNCSKNGSRNHPGNYLERLVAALGAGVVVLDSDSKIVWIDERTRARLNGGMEQFAATIRGIDRSETVSCSASAVDVSLNGESSVVCVIQETADQKEPGFDLVTAVEAAMADTSWFTRTIIEKLRALPLLKRPAAPIGDLDLLTDREREVLGLICEGRSDADMSRTLNLSQNTVRNHIASLYRKIGVNRRSAAIIWARERGITSQEAIGLRRRRRPHAGRPDARG